MARLVATLLVLLVVLVVGVSLAVIERSRANTWMKSRAIELQRLHGSGPMVHPVSASSGSVPLTDGGLAHPAPGSVATMGPGVCTRCGEPRSMSDRFCSECGNQYP
jgi:hypothetical protein